jgi:hypothetical protein
MSGLVDLTWQKPIPTRTARFRAHPITRLSRIVAPTCSDRARLVILCFVEAFHEV